MSSSDYVVLFVVVIFSIIYAVNAAVPPGWTCNASYYNASDGCHCNCGIRDPDCDNKNSTFYNVTYGCPCADMVFFLIEYSLILCSIAMGLNVVEIVTP